MDHGLGVFRMGLFAWEHSFGNMLLANLRLEVSSCDLSFDFSLGVFRFVIYDCRPSLKNFRMGRMGNWPPEAGGTAGRTPGEPWRTSCHCWVFEKTPSKSHSRKTNLWTKSNELSFNLVWPIPPFKSRTTMKSI